MQTFLPEADFEKISKILDYRRLGKQRVECYQILNTLSGKSSGWRNHPAVKMWMKHENSLVEYGLVMCEEWIKRGYKDTTMEKIKTFYDANSTKDLPEWFKDGRIHSSHRGTLLFKNFDHYKQFNWSELPIYFYYWPV